MTTRALRLSTPLLAAVAMVVMVIAPATAQEFAEDECYPLPLEECVEVGGVREERPPVAPAPGGDEVDGAPDGGDEVDGAPDVDVAGVQAERGAPQPADVAASAQELPRTGLDTAMALVAAIGLIGAGGYALRRSRAKRV